MFKLLSRSLFEEAVFERDGHKCVKCGQPAADAHHIIERRLWGDSQGYYVENGASVCNECHILCEMTKISVEELRELCNITRYPLPDCVYDGDIVDKWGNVFLTNGMRTKGPLFNDESVQKILKRGGMLDTFTHYVKYPRTFHVPWSPGIHSDDRVHKDMSWAKGERIIVTRKMDGESFTAMSDHCHARSVDSGNHPSRNWAKGKWGSIMGDIPPEWRVCCENLYAQHSIHYDNLESYLYGLSVWDNTNVCLEWDETVEWFQLFELPHCEILYDGIYDEASIKSLYDQQRDWNIHEGWVMRLAKRFHFRDFHKSVGKYVRSGHVQTNKHWMRGQAIVPNKLKYGHSD